MYMYSFVRTLMKKKNWVVIYEKYKNLKINKAYNFKNKFYLITI